METEELLRGIVDWYWKYGSRRRGAFELSAGSWLDQLYKITETVESLQQAATSTKACVALWGPSQSGKSLLLTKYVDYRPPSGDSSSALQWEESEKVFFSSLNKVDDNCVVLNPYNNGSDASYCVSRFTLADKVVDTSYPVEVCFANEALLLQFMAQGYHSECDRKRSSDQRIMRFDSTEFEICLSALHQSGPIDKKAYDKLHQLADVLEMLILAKLDRYANMEPSWSRSLRPKLLECAALNSNYDDVMRFAMNILWDGDGTDPISVAYKQLAEKCRQVAKRFNGRPVYCSHAVAKLFLNSDTFPRLTKRPYDAETKHLRQLVDRITVCEGRNEFKIGVNNGDKLFEANDSYIDFALFQGIIRELVFPLNRSFLDKNSKPFCQFLEMADLLDFPGVARYEKTQAPLTKEMLSGDDKSKIYSQVLKRGKTASIVTATAGTPTIDEFCILVKIADYPSNTDQLMTGIRVWLEGLGLSWPPNSESLPMNLVLTFCGHFVNDVVSGGASFGFNNAFDKIGILGALSNPKLVRHFLTTYPDCIDRGGKILEKDIGKIKTARDQIVSSDEFKFRFGHKSDTLDAMINNGGTDHLFEALEEQVRQSKRRTLIELRLKECKNEPKKLLIEICPPDVFKGDHRISELESWEDDIIRAISERRSKDPYEDAAAYVSFTLRTLLTVSVDVIQSIPLRCATIDVQEYVERQFERWQQSRYGKVERLSEVGLEDSAKTTKLLSYLCDYAIEYCDIVKWLQINLGYIVSPADAEYACHFLAMKMADTLAFGNQPRLSHRPFSEAMNTIPDCRSPFIQPRLHGYASNERRKGKERNDNESPHYLSFIEPFLAHLTAVKNVGGRARPAQPGDPELRNLISRSPLE